MYFNPVKVAFAHQVSATNNGESFQNLVAGNQNHCAVYWKYALCKLLVTDDQKLLYSIGIKVIKVWGPKKPGVMIFWYSYLLIYSNQLAYLQLITGNKFLKLLAKSLKITCKWISFLSLQLYWKMNLFFSIFHGLPLLNTSLYTSLIVNRLCMVFFKIIQNYVNNNIND